MSLLSVLTGVLEGVRKERSESSESSSIELRTLKAVVARNSAWLLGSRILNQGLAAAFTVIVARGMGETALGQYAFIASIVFIANVLTTFGTDTYLIRKVAAQPGSAHPEASAILAIQLSLSGLCVAASAVAGGMGHFSLEITRALFVFSLSLIPLAFFSVYSAILRARERMDLYLMTNLVQAGMQAGGAWVVVSLGAGVFGLAILTLMASTTSAALAVWLGLGISPRLRLQVRFPATAVREVIQRSIPLALLTGLAVIYLRLGVLMLGLLAGDAETGWYAAPFRLVEAFKVFHFALLGGIFPALARLPVQELAFSGQAGISRLLDGLNRWSLLLLTGFGVLAAFVTSMAAPAIIALVFGSSYGPSGPVLQILAWILVPYAITSHQSLVLVSRGREKRAVLATMLALFLAAGLNLVLVPRMGASGAATTAVVAESGLAISLWVLRKQTEK